jgi:phosphatidylserine/phosphatidylglycerophosphate/cardiolipin synthase-like enzyme
MGSGLGCFTKLVLTAILPIAVAACSSGSEAVQVDRGECDDIPGCQSVGDSAGKFAGDEDTFVNVRLDCPADYPYFWDWGYELDEGLEATLVEVYSPDIDPEVTPGAEIAIEWTGEGDGEGEYEVFIACSDEQMSYEDMGIAEESDDFEDPTLEEIEEDATVPSSAVKAASSETNYVSEAIWRQLTKQSDPEARMLGVTYQRSSDNELSSDAILQSPNSNLWGGLTSAFIYSGNTDCQSNCDATFNLHLCTSDADCADYSPATCRDVDASVTAPGMAPTKMCMRSQDVLWNELYKIVASAEKAADITTLYPPTGRFKDALKNAITYLANTGRTVNVRVAWGPLSGSADEFARYITAGAASVASSATTIYTARFVSGAVNWNHSKIIAADGRTAISGGQNLWDNDYLTINPVTDMSIKLAGSAAYDAQIYAQKIWEWLCSSSYSLSISWRDTYTVAPGTSEPVSGCSSTFPVTSRPTGTGTTSVIAVGRLASGIESDANQADDAILAIIKSARSSLKITQQSITYPGPPDILRGKLDYQPWMYAVAEKLLEGVDVYMVTSNDDSKPGRPPDGDNYNAFSTKMLAKKFLWYAMRRAGSMTEEEVKDLLCRKLHIARFRMNGTDSNWQDGRGFALHTKVYIADDMAYYVGSENFYPANLQEYGFIVADQGKTQQFITSFWDNIWRYSRRHAVIGSDMPSGRTCTLME